MLITRPLRLALPNDTDESSAISDGVYTQAELPAFVRLDADGVDQGSTPGVIAMGRVDGERQRGLDLYPLLTGGVDNSTIGVDIHRVNPIVDRGNNGVVRSFQVDLLYTLALTASATEREAGEIKEGTAYRTIDTAVLSVTSALATHLQSLGGDAIELYSPTSNGQAVISLPDLYGAWGVIVRPNASAGLFNALYELKT